MQEWNKRFIYTKKVKEEIKMGIAESMKSITENIITSNNIRVKALKHLVNDTQKSLKGFAANRKKLSEEQAIKLSAFVDGLEKEVNSMLKRFKANHKEMSAEQYKTLSDFVQGIKKDVATQLKVFHADRERMSKELRESLEKAKADREKVSKKLRESLEQAISEIKNYTANKLKEFNAAHTEMSAALKKSLAKYVGDIGSDVKKLLNEYGSDMEKAKVAWQEMAGSLAKSRKNRALPRVEGEEKTSTVDEVIEKKDKKKKQE